MSTESRSLPGNLPVTPKKTYFRPTDAELRSFASEMGNARPTEFDNLNVETKVVSRSKASTFIVSDTPEKHSDQTITRVKYDEMAGKQNEYIADQEMLVVDGYIGNDPSFRTPARLIIEKANANIAAMQKHLYFPLAKDDEDEFEPEVTVIYTPNLQAAGFPNDRLIACDLENNITRVFNSDYFGESKKGGLRMWNNIVQQRGGLAMHAGAKVIPVGDENHVCLIVGLSGTGKTTTTFTRQNGSLAVQDDFIAVMPGGKVHGTENGCFAKTYGLDAKYEPVIHAAVTCEHAYLENVSQTDAKIDFHDDSYTQNGRAVVRMADVENSADAREIGNAKFLLILNRNETVIPAVARLNKEQAAAYFMLGETKGTSAGGAEEAGKSLRVPGTNPFFPLLHAEQGNRFLELMESCNFDVYLMNTGRVGGPESVDSSKKVKIPHSSACVKGIAEGTIEWEMDPDFGYEVAVSVPEFDDPEILQPRKLYDRTGRMDEYTAQVDRLKTERAEYMKKWPGLDDRVAKAVS
ncbi:MAG: phosphoenolpyruvate carboxykinase [Acidobacteriota bacterium]